MSDQPETVTFETPEGTRVTCPPELATSFRGATVKAEKKAPAKKAASKSDKK